MSRSATPATRNEATRRLKPPKRTTSAKLPIGTAIRSSRERLRTVANGCDHKRNVERTHPQPPDPQSETGTLATHSGKMDIELIERFTLGVQSILTRMVLCFGKPASFGYSLHPVHYLIL